MGRPVKIGILFIALAALLIVGLPLLAVLAFSLRFALLALVVVAIIAVAVSPAFRRAIASDAEAATSYLGLRMPGDEMLFTRHTWARVEGDGNVAVGVDDLAQKVLGPAEAVELPAPGTEVRQGEPLFRVRHGKRTLTARAPVSGTVQAVNERLASEPRLVNEAPYGVGFAAVLVPKYMMASRNALKRGGQARAWLRSEIDRMMTALTPATSPVYALQDGGHLVDNLHDAVSDEAWETLRTDFFGDERK